MSYPAVGDGEGNGEGAAEGAKLGRLTQLVRERLQRGGAILIYTTTRKSAEQLAAMLRQHNINARHFHGKISREEKREVLEAFKTGALHVVTATCAFGMGINRADVRAVIHHTMSHNLEGYLQEAGRAGRDDGPADCILFFDPADAETIFYLQSLNQLGETELCRIFEAIRKMRDRIFDRAADDWFSVTVDDLLQEGSFDETFGKESEQRETKVKVALHYLEQFGLTERAENQSNYLQCDLAHATVQASLDRFNEYASERHLSEYQMAVFTRLIEALHLARAAADRGEEIPLREYLSDAAGIEAAQVIERVRELQRAGVCTYEIPVTLLIRKGVRSSASGKEVDAKRALSLLEQTEQRLLAALKELAAKDPDRTFLPIHLRGLARRLDPDGSEQIRAETLLKLLEEWTRREWLSMQRLNRDSIKIRMETIAQAADHLDTEQELRAATLDAIYEEIGAKTGARLRVTVEMQRLAGMVNTRIAPLAATSEELEKTMLALHQLGVIRITDGLQLMRQALKVRVIPRAAVTAIHRSYPLVEAHSRQQAQRTHIMLHYGSIAHDELVRKRFVDDYFHLPADAFARAYPGVTGEAMERPLTQDDYNCILGELNPEQRAIAQAGDAALVVIAGPGSGKTRTIVHRIAYLVKVRRVEPNRMLVLAYNRNAARELRIRLRDLIGPLAARLRVYTFHGLALMLLGRTVGERSAEMDFKQLIPQACDLLQYGDELEEEEDTQTRRLQLLGPVEHIFVDEYQDIDEDMYRFITLLAGLNDSGDDTRRVHINTCVIGDDDQNLYNFRGADVRHIREFEQEFSARRLLLVENYRSTEAIIEASNRLIAHNAARSKRTPDEQVRINDERIGHRGAAVHAYQFDSKEAQASNVAERVQRWLQAPVLSATSGSSCVKPGEIAVIARTWDQLTPVRLLLERNGIPTFALRAGKIGLLKQLATCQLLDDLRAESLRVWEAHESVEQWIHERAQVWGRDLHEPTMMALCKIASDIDRERGFGSPDLALPISCDEILTSLYEFVNESDRIQVVDEDSVLFTTCHSAKGLEFRKVILLADGFKVQANKIESERRAFYVAMTRAKKELVLSTLTPNNSFLHEAGIVATAAPLRETTAAALPTHMYYSDFTPKHVNLGHLATREQQKVICALHEGAPLHLRAREDKYGWLILTESGVHIGVLSREGTSGLKEKGMSPNHFAFLPGEVTLRAIFHHMKTDEVTGDVQEDWFVPIPQIRICR